MKKLILSLLITLVFMGGTIMTEAKSWDKTFKKANLSMLKKFILKTDTA